MLWLFDIDIEKGFVDICCMDILIVLFCFFKVLFLIKKNYGNYDKNECGNENVFKKVWLVEYGYVCMCIENFF